MLTPTEEIKSRLDIVELISEFVPLKQSGTNFKGLCPFHNEKTPSFMVSRDKQFFKCFGCGEGGDIFTFLQKIENIEFPEALRILAEKAGVELKTQNYNPEFNNLKTQLYDLHEAVIRFYSDQLWNYPSAKTARDYLIKFRGLSEQVIKEFQLGYAPDSWDVTSKYLRSHGFTDAEIRQSGLVVEKNNYSQGSNYYDRFRDRIMFPIIDHHGNTVGFTARTLKSDEPAKYINTPTTVIYNKSQVIFGLAKAKTSIKDKDFVVLVEGNMDVIASHAAGVTNVVAASGTALTTDQINILKRYTKNLVMCFDADAAGVVAAERGIELAWQADLNIKVIILPTGIKDPDELIKKSAAAWVEAVNKKVNFMDYFFEINLARQNLNDIDVKRKVGTRLLSWIAKLTDPILRDHYLKLLAGHLNVSESSLRESLAKLKNRQKNPSVLSPISSRLATPKTQINKFQAISERLLALVIAYPDYLSEIVQKLPPELLASQFQDFYKQLIFRYTKDNEFNIKSWQIELEAENKELASIYDTLKLLAENELTDLARYDLNREFDLSVNYLKRHHISSHLKKIESEIKAAESNGNASRANELLREFVELSHELAGI